MYLLSGIIRCAIFAAALVFLPVGPTAAAQDSALLAQQRELFQKILEDPADLETMFQYAMVSIQLEDLEPAITTLERMLLFNADLPRVKVELGAAYFRLGAFETADYYFRQVLEGDPPSAVRERVEQFRAAIAAHDQADDPISGYVSAGVVYSTNANLGPDERLIDAAVIGGTAFLDPDATSRNDVGFRASAFVRHSHELDRREGDAWLSDVALTSLHFVDETPGDLDAVRVSTGPSILISDAARPARLRPFAEATYVRSGNDPLYVSYGGGIELSRPLDDRVALFAGASAAYRDYLGDLDEFDGLNLAVSAGAAYRMGERTVARGTIFADTDQTDRDFTQNYEAGLRLALDHSYDSGIDLLSKRPWLVSAFAQASRRWFDATDPAVNPNRDRRDWDLSLGLSNVVPVTDRLSVVTAARYFDRNSNIRNFELDSLEVGLDVQLAF